MRLLILGIALLLIVGAVSAQTYTYKIQGEHQGIVTLDTSGQGTITDGARSAQFSWSGSDGHYVARYWWWSVPFTVSGNTLASPSFPGDVGILVK